MHYTVCTSAFSDCRSVRFVLIPETKACAFRRCYSGKPGSDKRQFLTMTGICSQDSDSLQTGNLLCVGFTIFSSHIGHLHRAGLPSTLCVCVRESVKWIAGDFLHRTSRVFAHRPHIELPAAGDSHNTQSQLNAIKIHFILKPRVWHKLTLICGCRSSNLTT